MTIHKLLLVNTNDSRHFTLYDDNVIPIENTLLASFVSALLSFSNEFGEAKGALREVEFGKYQISLLHINELAYCLLHDTTDNEYFTREVLDQIINKYHAYFIDLPFEKGIGNETIPEDLKHLVQTMVFPQALKPKALELGNQFLAKHHTKIDALFLADFDDGLVLTWKDTKEHLVKKMMIELLSEIPFERYWIGESKYFTSKEEEQDNDYFEGLHEGWFYWRVNKSDFCIVLRAIYLLEDKNMLIRDLTYLAKNLGDLIIQLGNSFTNQS